MSSSAQLITCLLPFVQHVVSKPQRSHGKIHPCCGMLPLLRHATPLLGGRGKGALDQRNNTQFPQAWNPHAQAGQKSLESLHVCLLPFTFLQAICLIDIHHCQTSQTVVCHSQRVPTLLASESSLMPRHAAACRGMLQTPPLQRTPIGSHCGMPRHAAYPWGLVVS